MLALICYVLAAFCFALSSFPLASPPRVWGSLVPLGLFFLTIALASGHGISFP